MHAFMKIDPAKEPLKDEIFENGMQMIWVTISRILLKLPMCLTGIWTPYLVDGYGNTHFSNPVRRLKKKVKKRYKYLTNK
jgi:hypothetical protein